MKTFSFSRKERGFHTTTFFFISLITMSTGYVERSYFAGANYRDQRSTRQRGAKVIVYIGEPAAGDRIAEKNCQPRNRGVACSKIYCAFFTIHDDYYNRSFLRRGLLSYSFSCLKRLSLSRPLFLSLFPRSRNHNDYKNLPGQRGMRGAAETRASLNNNS